MSRCDPLTNQQRKRKIATKTTAGTNMIATLSPNCKGRSHFTKDTRSELHSDTAILSSSKRSLTATMTSTKNIDTMSNKKPRPKRSVSFHVSVTVRPSLHIVDYTENEINLCWYKAEEYRSIRADIHRAVNCLQKQHQQQEQQHEQQQGEYPAAQHEHKHEENTNERCWRGIECKTRQSRSRRQQLRLSGWYAVFSEQERQGWSKTCEPSHIIAHAYGSASAPAVAIARAVAISDELDAKFSI